MTACVHASPVDDSEKGETVCGNCGQVMDERKVYTECEGGRVFDTELHADNRYNAPMTRSGEAQMGTFISLKDVHGKQVNTYRLRMWQRRSVENKERKMFQPANLVYTLLSKLGIDSVSPIASRSNEIMRQFLKKRTSRGRTTASFVAASVYLACREQGVPRSLKEISSSSDIRRTTLGSSYRNIVKTLYGESDAIVPSPDVRSFVSRFSKMLDKKSEIKNSLLERKALQYMDRRDVTDELEGKAPDSSAAALLYCASIELGMGYRQKDIAKTCSVTEVTLRNVYKFLKPVLAKGFT